MKSAEEWAEEHVRSRQKGCWEMAEWIRAIQRDALEAAAKVCVGFEQWYAAKNYDRHELVGSALHVAAGDIRKLAQGGGGVGGE